MIAKLSCAVGAGLCVVAFPGSLAWLVPGAALTGLVVYENTTPPEERAEALRQLAASAGPMLAAPVNAIRTIEHWRRTGEWGRGAKEPKLLASTPALGNTGAAPGMFEEADLLAALASEKPYQLGAFIRKVSQKTGYTLPEVYQEVCRVRQFWAHQAEAERLEGPAVVEDVPTQQPARQPAHEHQVEERPAWLKVVNDEPDQRPHMLILGPTRSGKTTLATAAMGDRDGRAVVITPKLNPSNWRGAEIVTLDDDGTYAPITAALDAIEQEKRERIKVLRTRGADALDPLTIVFDEIGELAAFEPRAPEMMTQLSSMGAELKLRIIGIGTSDEALGVKRWKATRNNYVRIETDADRRATLDDGVRTLPVVTQDVVPRAQVAQLRPWRGGPVQAPATGTTQNLRAPAEPAQVILAAPAPASAAARAAASDPLLASLMTELPPAVKAAVPDITPDRAARLAQILAAQGLTEQQVIHIASGPGDTYIFNQNKLEVPPSAPQPAPAPAPVRPPRARYAAPYRVRRRGKRDTYQQAKAIIASGGSANDVQRDLRIKRREALELARRARAELGVAEGGSHG